MSIKINGKTASEWFDIGYDYSLSGNHHKAIKCYETVVKIDPKHKDAWNNIGRACLMFGKYKRAIQCFDKAVKLDPQFALAWFNMGETYGNLGDHQKQKECYEKAIKIDPQFESLCNKEVYINKAIEYYQKGDLKRWFDMTKVEKKIDLNETADFLKISKKEFKNIIDNLIADNKLKGKFKKDIFIIESDIDIAILNLEAQFKSWKE